MKRREEDPVELTEEALEAALAALKEEIFSSLHVAAPGTVLSYDPATRTVEAQPALRRQIPSGGSVPAPVLRKVPVCLPDPSREVVPGEPCLLVFADFCLDGWMETGTPAVPASPRSHDWSDAFALVGFRR